MKEGEEPQTNSRHTLLEQRKAASNLRLGERARERERMPSRGDNLHLAASRGKTYRVHACLANDEDPNQLDAQGRTPLTIAIKGGHLEVW